MDRRLVLLAVLGVHLAVAVIHGTTHALIPVALPAWQNALVLATVFVGPAAGVALALRGHPLGLSLFTVTMAGALFLGGVLHFLVENPDHVSAVPAHGLGPLFVASAAGVAVVPAVGTAVGAWYWQTGQ